MISHEQIHAAVDRYFAANNALDADAVVSLFAPDARMYRVPGELPVEGREVIHRAYQQLLGAFSRIDAQPLQTFVQGNGAAVLYRGQFTSKGGKSVEVEAINVYAVNEEGLIAEIRYYWDPASFYSALRGS